MDMQIIFVVTNRMYNYIANTNAYKCTYRRMKIQNITLVRIRSLYLLWLSAEMSRLKKNYHVSSVVRVSKSLSHSNSVPANLWRIMGYVNSSNGKFVFEAIYAGIPVTAHDHSNNLTKLYWLKIWEKIMLQKSSIF